MKLSKLRRALRAMNLLNLGLYAPAGAAAGDLVRVLEKSLPFESYFGLVFIERIGNALANVPAPRLDRPGHTVTVPMKCEAVGRGHHLYIPVEVNGPERDVIFDTGCPFGCFVSEHYAAEVGLTIVADSIPVSGIRPATLLTVGSLGADFVRAFHRLTINSGRMFIRGE